VEVEDPRAADVAIMQSLIKGLADQLNGPMGKPAPARGAVAPQAAPHPPAPARDVTPALPRDTVTPPARTSTEEQVGALRGIADAMRTIPSVRSAEGTALGDGFGVEDELADAIEASRIDVYLDPILGLDDHRARHFEVSVRLRREDGESMDPRALASAIAGTGLGPRIEALTFTESLRLAGEFAARGSSADLFSTASGESLRDGGFHAALSVALAPDFALGARLVMSISQAEVRAFGPAHWEALAALAQAGLRYALVDVVDLDTDFEGLAIRGFEFVRLDARVFLQGLPAPHGFVPAADLCRHLASFGFTLIVGRIAEERELVKVLGFGALLGQGRLFGGPRPIRQDRSAHRTSAA
jgi:cyclic-di-GMP phosphodiesterase TipF (flagellum assembly factor)